jgi:hypothetical protein
VANTLLPAGGGWLASGHDWGNAGDTYKVALLRGYVINTAHVFLSDVTGSGATVVASDTLLGRTVGSTTGVLDANDNSLGAVGTGAACNNLGIYQDSGAAGSSHLVMIIDTASGLPLTPNGSTVNVLWDNGANKIVKIGG